MKKYCAKQIPPKSGICGIINRINDSKRNKPPHQKLTYITKIIQKLNILKISLNYFKTDFGVGVKIAIFWCVVGLIVISLPKFSMAQDSTSASFAVEDPVIDTGFESSTSTNFGLGQSFSQIAIGKSTSASFELWSGFQYYFETDANTLTATSGDSEVDLNWTVPNTYLGISIGSYEVGTGVVSGSYTFQNVGNVTNFTKVGLTNGTPYFFIIKALSPIGSFLVFSNEDTATPTGVVPPPPPSGGGGSSNPSMIISGQAFPGASITLVRDSLITSSGIANSTGYFQVNLTGLSSGTYNFLLYATDPDGHRSASISFQSTLTQGVTTTVNNLLLSPTITTNFSVVKQGEPLTVSGYAAPNSSVTIRLTADGIYQTFATTSDASGKYSYSLVTNNLALGLYYLKSYVVYNGVLSPDSLSISFNISDRSVPRDGGGCTIRSDLNCDGRVDLVDFSILLYFWEGANDLSKNPRADIDGSGYVDIVDFSIMLYDWTG